MNEILFCLILGFVLDIIFIVEYYRNHYTSLLVFKTVSSAVFVVLGILLTLQFKNTLLSWLVVCGLICGILGDFFLDAGPVIKRIEKNAFMFGFGAFFVGHLLYIARTMNLLVKNQKGIWIVIVLAVTFVVGSIVIKLMFKICKPTDDILKVGIAYLLTLDYSCLLAWTLLSTASGSLCLAFGTTLFAVSDHMLVADYFGFKKVNWLHGVLLILYYMAQCLIALSIIY